MITQKSQLWSIHVKVADDEQWQISFSKLKMIALFSAAQVTGLAVGQKLRSMNIKTVRCRVAGFNAGRIAAIKGINQVI